MTISEPSQPTLFDETELPSMSSAAGFPAKTLASLEQELASAVNDLVSGESTGDLLANYDRDSSSWRTSQACLVSEWEPFSETWPRSGTMQHGTAYQHRPLVRLTDGIASGLLPMPEASNTKAVAMRSGGRPPKSYLPTPTAKANMMAPSMQKWPSHRNLFPTPVARDCRTIKGAQRVPNATGTEPLTVVVGQMENATTGALNPTWVEWLMGFPSEWTALEPLETASSPKSPNSSEGQS